MKDILLPVKSAFDESSAAFDAYLFQRLLAESKSKLIPGEVFQAGDKSASAMLALLGKLTIAGGVLAGVCWLGSHYLLADWPTQAFLPKCLDLFATIAVAGVAFVVVASALKIQELNDIIAAFQRRLRRKRAR